MTVVFFSCFRFGVFEYVNYKLEDIHGDLSLKHTFFAGMIAGMAEAVIVVTPVETIKVNVINEMAKPNPRYLGVFSAIKNITKRQGNMKQCRMMLYHKLLFNIEQLQPILGIRGLYMGLSITALKEGTNQAVRFYLMCTQKDFYTGHDNAVLIPMPMIGIFGMIAGAASVLAHLSGDVIWSRMQSRIHKCNSPFECFKKILKDEGPKTFLKGNTSLMARVCIEVAITFMVYESIVDYVYDNFI